MEMHVPMMRAFLKSPNEQTNIRMVESEHRQPEQPATAPSAPTLRGVATSFEIMMPSDVFSNKKNTVIAMFIFVNMIVAALGALTLHFCILDFKFIVRHVDGILGASAVSLFFFMGFGATALIVSVYGWVAFNAEDAKLLIFYNGALKCLIVLEILGVLYVGNDHFTPVDQVTKWLTENYVSPMLNVNTTRKDSWKALQSDFNCCRLSNEYRNEFGIDGSCCPGYEKDDPNAEVLFKTCLEHRTYYKFGCSQVVTAFLERSNCIILGLLVTAIVFQVAAMITAMHYMKPHQSFGVIKGKIYKYLNSANNVQRHMIHA